MTQTNCEGCGVPNKTSVLRLFGWWTMPTLEATAWALNGHFADVLPGMRRESNGAVIEAVPGNQFIALPWNHVKTSITACFTNWGQHRWVYIRLSVFGGKALCQWCRFQSDGRFQRRGRAA